MEKLTFTLQLKHLDVEIDGKPYVLKELTGRQRDAYLTKNASKMKYVKGKPAGLTTFDGIQTDLLEQCLFDGDGKPVAASVMANWPAHVQEALFDAARELSKIGKEKLADDDKKDGDGDDEAKNE